MDSKSLFLTANADTVYYFTFLDLTKGRGWEVSAAASGLSRRDSGPESADIQRLRDGRAVYLAPLH